MHTAFIHGLSSMSFGTRVRLFAGALNGGIPASNPSRDRVRSDRRPGVWVGGFWTASGRGVEYPLPPAGKGRDRKDSHVSNTPNRSLSEGAAFDFVQRGVRASAVRLAPTVHGDGDHGFIPQIIQAARKKGVSPYIGDGANRWPAVHRLDAAKLFRPALEKGEAGARYGVEEAGIPFRDIASLIATRLKVSAVSIPASKAAKHFEVLARFIGLDNPASSEWTRQVLGWHPEQVGLIADMNANYFNSSGS
jgi:hypothetical protein